MLNKREKFVKVYGTFLIYGSPPPLTETPFSARAPCVSTALGIAFVDVAKIRLNCKSRQKQFQKRQCKD